MIDVEIAGCWHLVLAFKRNLRLKPLAETSSTEPGQASIHLHLLDFTQTLVSQPWIRLCTSRLPVDKSVDPRHTTPKIIESFVLDFDPATFTTITRQPVL